MSWSRGYFLMLCYVSSAAEQATGDGEVSNRDWRHALLAEESIATDAETLEKLSKSCEFSKPDFDAAVARLANPQLMVRRQAQRELERMGEAALPHIKKSSGMTDAETRQRLTAVVESFAKEDRCHGRTLLMRAAEGLLYEQRNPGKHHASRQVYRQTFAPSQQSLTSGYYGMKLADAIKTDGLVEDGMLQ